jgi:hypothetical protein
MTISDEVEQEIRDYVRQEIRGIYPTVRHRANELMYNHAVDYIRIYDEEKELFVKSLNPKVTNDKKDDS